MEIYNKRGNGERGRKDRGLSLYAIFITLKNAGLHRRNAQKIKCLLCIF